MIICLFIGDIHQEYGQQKQIIQIKERNKMFEIIGSFYGLKKNFIFRKLNSLDILNYLLFRKTINNFSKANYNAYKSIYYWPITKI